MTRLTGKLIPKENKGVKIHASFYTDDENGSSTSDYQDLENKPSINSVVLNGNVTSNDLGLSNKESIVELSDSIINLTPLNDTIYNCQEVQSIDITLPQQIDVNFMAQINFSSGTTPTILTDDGDINWLGDDIDGNGNFVPVASKRYVVILYSDGVDMRGQVTATTPLS